MMSAKKEEKRTVTLIVAHNWGLMKSCIDKNWKLEDWIDKTES